MNRSFSRRRFLAASGGALAVPWVVGAASPAQAASAAQDSTRASAAGPPGTTPPSERIGLGVIGVGIQNRSHLGRLVKRNDVRVLAVCDVDTVRREAAKKLVDEAYGNSDCAAYVEDGDVLARKDIDAVVIATPDHWHAIQVIAACRAKKDIYCEKPLSLSIAEAKRMIDIVREHDRVFQTGSQQRTEFGAIFARACELVRNGRIGKVLNVSVGVGDPSTFCTLPEEPLEPGLEWNRWLGPAAARPYNSVLSPRGVHGHYPKWREYREYSGGYTTDMGAHHFDIVQWALKADESGPLLVTPPLGWKADPNPKPGTARGAALRYANGTVVTHGGPSGATFIGTDGMIHVDRGRIASVSEEILKTPLGEHDEKLPRPGDHFTDWIDCIRLRRRPVCDVEVGARSVTCCHLINLAYWYGRPLRWDPQTWTFSGDPEAELWKDVPRREGYSLA